MIRVQYFARYRETIGVDGEQLAWQDGFASLDDLRNHLLARAAIGRMRTSVVGTGLVCHAQVDAEALKKEGAAGCLLKPITETRLIPLLLEHCPNGQPALRPVDEQGKLPMTVMAVDDNPANLKLIAGRAPMEASKEHVPMQPSAL